MNIIIPPTLKSIGFIQKFWKIPKYPLTTCKTEVYRGLKREKSPKKPKNAAPRTPGVEKYPEKGEKVDDKAKTSNQGKRKHGEEGRSGFSGYGQPP